MQQGDPMELNFEGLKIQKRNLLLLELCLLLYFTFTFQDVEYLFPGGPAFALCSGL